MLHSRTAPRVQQGRKRAAPVDDDSDMFVFCCNTFCLVLNILYSEVIEPPPPVKKVKKEVRPVPGSPEFKQQSPVTITYIWSCLLSLWSHSYACLFYRSEAGKNAFGKVAKKISFGAAESVFLFVLSALAHGTTSADGNLSANETLQLAPPPEIKEKRKLALWSVLWLFFWLISI